MIYLVFGNKKMKSESNKSRKKLFIIASLLFTGFACAEVYMLRNVVKISNARQKTLYESIRELEEMDAEFFLIQPAIGLRHEFSDPLKSNNYKFKTIPDGWTIFSPSFYKALREFDMEHAHEIFSRLVSEERYFFVGNNELFITRISMYLRENYGLYHRVIRVKQLSNQSIVYKFEALKAY
jgi:hypothetical protein